MKTIIKLGSLVLVIMMITGLNAFSQEEAISKNKDENICTVTFPAGVKCGNCKAKIEKDLAFQKGVKSVVASVEDKTVTVKFDKSKNCCTSFVEAVKKLGYTAEMPEGHSEDGTKHKDCKKNKEVHKDCKKKEVPK